MLENAGEVEISINSLQNSQLICLGGVNRGIVSLSELCRDENGNDANGEFPGIKSREQYASMLFSNLGFKGYPRTFEWLDDKAPIENQKITEPHIYPITDNLLQVNPEGTSLWNLLVIICNWGRGIYERGSILDVEESFQLPPLEEIKYDIQNGIAMYRTAEVFEVPRVWSTSDIITRRAHNICPKINKNYFCNCIRAFEFYARQIIVKNPCIIFSLGIMNPDVLMSTIRSAEMEAADVVNKRYAGYSAVRPDFDTAKEFIPILESKFERFVNIFKVHGYQGFADAYVLDKNKDGKRYESALSNDMRIILKPTEPINENDGFSHLSLEEKKKAINDVEVDENVKGFILKYMEAKTISDYVVENGDIQLGRTGDGRIIIANKQEHIALMKRLYILLRQAEVYLPEALSRASTKWIVSTPFYINPDSFGIYNQSLNLYILALPEVTSIVVDPQDAVKAYKAQYSKDVLLSPEELGNSYETPECKDTVLKEGVPKDVLIVEGQIPKGEGPVFPTPTTAPSTNPQDPVSRYNSINGPLNGPLFEPKGKEYGLNKDALVEK